MSTVLASSADVVKIWAVGEKHAEPALKSVVPLPCDSVQQINWNHNNELLAACGTESTVGLISEAGQLLVQLPFDQQDPAQRMNGFVSALCFNKTSRYLCTAGEDLDIMVWNLKRRQLIGKLVGLTGLASSLQFFRAADTLMSADLGGKVVIWKITAGKQEQVLLHPQAPQQSAVHACRISPFSQSTMASVYGDGSCCLWDVPSATCTGVLPKKHDGMAWGVVFSPTNKNLLVTGGEDGYAKFFDVSNQKFISSVPGGAAVSAVDFHPNGTSVAIGTVQGTVLEYDLRNPGTPTFTLNAHQPHRITSLSFHQPQPRQSLRASLAGAAAAQAPPKAAAPTAASEHGDSAPTTPKGTEAPPSRLMKSQTETTLRRDDPRRFSFSSQTSDSSLNSRPIGNIPSISSISSASMSHIESRYSSKYLSQVDPSKSPRRFTDTYSIKSSDGDGSSAAVASQEAADAAAMPPPRTPPSYLSNASNGAADIDSGKSDVGTLLEQLRQRSGSASSQGSAAAAIASSLDAVASTTSTNQPALLSQNPSFAVTDCASDKVRTAVESASRPTSERFSTSRAGDRSPANTGVRDYAARFEAAAAMTARDEEASESSRLRNSTRGHTPNSSTIVHDAHQLVQPVSSRMLQEQLQTLRYDVHRDMQTVIKEITRQFDCQQDEIMTMFAGFDKRLQDLADENRLLREENEKLRNIY